MNDKIGRVCLTSAMLFSLALVLTHVGLLGYGIVTDDLVFFWVPLVLMGSIAFYSVFSYNSRFPLVLILLFALSLHLIQFVRQPADMIWNPDAIYNLQLVNHVSDTGRWDFGYGTDEAYGYSYYPLFPIFQWALSSLSSISPMLCMKYSMAILNLLTLLTIYFLLKMTFHLDMRSINLIILLFSFNPMFHANDSYAHAESYAIILYPLILSLMLRQENPKDLGRVRIQAVSIFLLVAVSMSHHFTSYMVAFSLLIPTMILYLLRKDFFSNLRLNLLSLILPLTWLTFIASFILARHFGSFLEIVSRLTSIQGLVGYSYSPVSSSVAYYPSEFSMQITLFRTVLLVACAFVGLLFCSNPSNKKAQNHFRVLLIAYGVVTALLLYFVDWKGIVMKGIVLADIRDRIIAFSYLPLSFFSSLGILAIIGKAPRWPNSRFLRGSAKLFLGIIFITVLTTATVFNAFPRFMYDSTYTPISSAEFPVAAEQQYALGHWTFLCVSNLSSEETCFTGSLSAHKYVVGYGLFKGEWDKTLFNNITTISNDPRRILYVINTYNFQLPDQLGQKLPAATLQVLDKTFYKVYDNGVISVYEHQKGPS